MSATHILERLAVAGVKLTAESGVLWAEPESALTDDLCTLIRSNKADLLALLSPSRGHGRAQRGQERRSPHGWRCPPPACTGVVRLRMVLESEDGARTEAILEIPHEPYHDMRVLEMFERHRMAGTSRVISVVQEAPDDRHHCRDCARLRNGACTAARAIGAQDGYRPVDDLPRRCEGFEEGGRR